MEASVDVGDRVTDRHTDIQTDGQMNFKSSLKAPFLYLGRGLIIAGINAIKSDNHITVLSADLF